MKNNNPYDIFPNYVLRSPILPLGFYHSLTKNQVTTDEQLKEICQLPIIQESLFLASPSLYNKMISWLEGNVEIKKDELRLKYAILKYISRMSSRCTPFGLFAGCALGDFENDTDIQLDNAETFSRHTRLDMNYLVGLSQDLANRPEVKSQILFSPNSSIYEVGHQLRYVEYKYVNSMRHHHIASVSNSEYLNRILEHAHKGAILEDLAKLIVEDGITIEDASGFVNQLVENQLLISELEPSVSGPEFLTQMTDVLKKLSGVDHIINTIQEIKNACNTLDKKIGNDTKMYKDLTEIIKTLDSEFDEKYLFQTDLVLKPTKNQLDLKIAFSIRRALTFLNKINPKSSNTLLDKFRQAFSSRYESREMPLSKVLDLEIGIGFQQNQSSDDPDPILDNLFLPSPKNNNVEIEYRLNSTHRILHKLILESIKNNYKTISLKDKDFDFLDSNWNDTPDTISFMVEVLELDGQEKIKILPSGSSSAANLLGRFCHGDQELLKHSQSIIDIEEKINKNKILAEIVHLPEARVGNVLMRPSFRKTEIPYLAKSVLPSDQQLAIDDLMVSVRGNKIILRSKKHNKEVIPRLTNAHNFMSNALPIYQFLALMQTQNTRAGFSLDLGPLAEEFSHIPRIEYQDVILKPGSWKIKNSEINDLIMSQNNDSKLYTCIQGFCKERNLPSLVLLKDGDNELLVNFENLTSVRMWLSLIKKRESFKLDEFIFGNEGIVKDSSGNSNHTNQFIISYYHKERLQVKKETHENSKNLYHW